MATIAVPTLIELRKDLREAVRSGEDERAAGLVDLFHAQVMEALGTNDRRQLAKLGGEVQRLRHVVDASEREMIGLQADLRRIARTIEIAWTQQAMSGSRQEPTVPAKFTVRERVLAAIAERPQRPGEIAAELQLDRTQVSRALRQLRRAGQALPAAEAADDQRATYWRAA